MAFEVGYFTAEIIPTSELMVACLAAICFGSTIN